MEEKKTIQKTYWIEPSRHKRWTEATFRKRLKSRAELLLRAVEKYIK